MNCEEATLFLAARIDGESTGDDAPLDAHLAECETCRRTLSEMELADAALLRAFSSRRETAFALADRVTQAISHDAKTYRSVQAALLRQRFVRWAGLVAAAAAGFLLAILLVRTRDSQMTPPRFTPAMQVAHLTLATGNTFTCPPNQHDWRPISPGDSVDLGATVRTADDSKCELQLADGSCVRLNKGTSALFAGDRAVQVSGGQIWSAVARTASPLRVSAGDTHVTAGGSGRGSQFELSCVANAATVTVQQGSADVAGNGPRTTVHGGEMLHAPSPTVSASCVAMPDPLLSTGWQDELLALKPADDPEVVARIIQLVSRIAMDRRLTDVPGETEQHLRARGQAWSAAMVHYLQSPPADGDRDDRRTAARLVADLAPGACIPGLIRLLTDSEDEVRYNAAVALRRLTGQTLGYSPETCRASRSASAAADWGKWWEQNKLRYTGGK